MLMTVDLRSRSVLARMMSSTPLNTCVFLSESCVAAGGDSGLVQVFDLRRPGEALLSYQRSDASVLHMCAHVPLHNASPTSSLASLLVACDDGSVFTLDADGVARHDLVGPADMDRTRAVVCSSACVWTAGLDGVVRQYDQADLS